MDYQKYDYANEHCFPRLPAHCQISSATLASSRISAQGNNTKFKQKKMQLEKKCWRCAIDASPKAFTSDFGFDRFHPKKTALDCPQVRTIYVFDCSAVNTVIN